METFFDSHEPATTEAPGTEAATDFPFAKDDGQIEPHEDTIAATDVPETRTDGPPPNETGWQEQSENGLCVPAAVAIMATRLTGELYTEEEVVAVATAAPPLLQGGPGNWAGMTAGEAEALLQRLGIPAETHQDGTVARLTELAQEGREVWIAIDSDEVWYGRDDDDDSSDEMADHALVFDRVEGDEVVLQDPGNPDGESYRMSVQDFEDAWADGNSEYVVTGTEAEMRDEPISEAAQPGQPEGQPAQPEPADPAPAPPAAPAQPGPGATPPSEPLMPQHEPAMPGEPAPAAPAPEQPAPAQPAPVQPAPAPVAPTPTPAPAPAPGEPGPVLVPIHMNHGPLYKA